MRVPGLHAQVAVMQAHLPSMLDLPIFQEIPEIWVF